MNKALSSWLATKHADPRNPMIHDPDVLIHYGPRNKVVYVFNALVDPTIDATHLSTRFNPSLLVRYVESAINSMHWLCSSLLLAVL